VYKILTGFELPIMVVEELAKLRAENEDINRRNLEGIDGYG